MKKVLNKILNVDYVVAIAAFIGLVAVTFIGVIMRYILNAPLLWQEELQLVLIIWIVYFGISAAMRARSHVAIELVVDAFPRTLKMVVEIVGYVIVVLIMIYLTIQGIGYVQQMSASSRVTNFLRIPQSLTVVAFPIGCFLTIISQILVLIEDIKAYINHDDEKKIEGGEIE